VGHKFSVLSITTTHTVRSSYIYSGFFDMVNFSKFHAILLPVVIILLCCWVIDVNRLLSSQNDPHPVLVGLLFVLLGLRAILSGQCRGETRTLI